MEDLKKEKPNLLYVDDEENNLTSFKQLFRRQFNIRIALSADEGMEILEDDEIEIVISDQRMPGITGTEFLEKVAAKFPDTIRFMLTGYSDLQAVVDAVNYGKLDGYLSKPLDSELLIKKIKKGLELKNLRKENTILIDEVRESEEKFKGVIESAPDGMIIVNHKMEIILVNKQFEKIFNHNRKEVLGQKIAVIIPDRFTEHSAHVEKYKNNHERHEMGKGRELFAKKKDGTEFPAEITLSPFHTKEGLIVIASIRDITERKKNESELNKYKNNLEDLVNERTNELKTSNSLLKKKSEELEMFNSSMLNREMRIIELKEEVNILKKNSGQEIPYPEIWNKKN